MTESQGNDDVAEGNDDDAEYVSNYDDVSVFELASDREQAMLDAQTECCFMWTTRAGDPVGVIMNFVEKSGHFWLTCVRQRKRVPAILARPRVAIAISSRGTDIGISQTVTYKGNAIVHDDADTKAWFYVALAAKVRPENAVTQKAFIDHLESPDRVVIEIVPDKRIGFDSESMFKGSPAGPTRTNV